MRFRLILLCLIVGILPCLVLRAGFLKAYEDQAASTRSIAIISQAKILADQIAANDYINKQNTESITVQLNRRIDLSICHFCIRQTGTSASQDGEIYP